jgi:hypothetical protein
MNKRIILQAVGAILMSGALALRIYQGKLSQPERHWYGNNIDLLFIFLFYTVLSYAALHIIVETYKQVKKKRRKN